MLKKTLLLAMLASLVVPAAAMADPNREDRGEAQRECRLEREAMGDEAFAEKYGTGERKRNAFGKCVSRTTHEAHEERHAANREARKSCKEDDAKRMKACVERRSERVEKADDAEDRTARSAAKDCRRERADLGREAFADKYGTNHNKRNAFGKCVSGKAGDDETEAETETETQDEGKGRPAHAGRPDHAGPPAKA